jgi:hypothetical protein
MTSRTDTAWVHWAENLDVANGIKAEASGNARLYEGDDAAHSLLRLLGGYEVEIRFAVLRAEIR